MTTPVAPTFLPHWRLTMAGRLGTSGEIFQTGLALGEGQAGAGLEDAYQGEGQAGGRVTLNRDQFDDIVADCVAFWARPASGIHESAILTSVKLALINADGGTTEEPYVTSVSQAGMGSNQISRPANQLALAVSLQTRRYGPTGRGRMYLPLPAAACTHDGLYSDTYSQGVATSVATFIDALNNEPGVDAVNIGVVVASSKGYNSAVTGVRVGRAPDTMRSRRASLGEAYGATVAVQTNGANI